ncbi:DUF5709 domain-containing protein [Plantactinospora endophytica]|uniref:DUF5709 domain-containing protein n=1 Tax=Plantactinospora endophytica TaxID=673535 RepID=A0ABQ4DTV7_9ACTN|nr:DUF5709 domain-containing protein [Plantactinospora endophytica]GIG85899.1 hypothetical protein Pen02_08350 [Plantactinospora endophytica]
MRSNEFPTPVSDPEAEGLPGTADDDSSAGDDVATGREADGWDPAALPADRPLAVDRYGNTAEEQADGEPLDYKLGQERPELLVDDPLAGPVDQAISGEADSDEAAAEAQLDADVMDPGPTSDPNSPVSIYDHGNLGDAPGGGPVGRLVEPDEGARDDDETDSVAFDRGAAGGGASAEELAINETQPPP